MYWILKPNVFILYIECHIAFTVNWTVRTVDERKNVSFNEVKLLTLLPTFFFMFYFSYKSWIFFMPFHFEFNELFLSRGSVRVAFDIDIDVAFNTIL